MTRLRTHNLRAKRRLRVKVPWILRVRPRRPARKLTLEKMLGLKERLAEGKLILHPVSNADLLEELRAGREDALRYVMEARPFGPKP